MKWMILVLMLLPLRVQAQEWRCENLGQGLHQDMGSIAQSPLYKPFDAEKFWTIYWNTASNKIDKVAQIVGESLFQRGAIFVNKDFLTGYDTRGRYYIFSNYKINGTTCSVLIRGNQVSILYDSKYNE